MNTGIITHYDVHNHGAILQLLALIRVLRQNFNVEAKALRFAKNYDFFDASQKNKYELSWRSFKVYWQYLSERGIGATQYNIRKRITLEKFKKDVGIIGDFYSEYKDLDRVVIGSDEVFALHTGPTPVFLGHALPTKSVFSYAASFGPTTIEDVYRLNCDSLISSGLSRMQGVSVRDQNSKEIVHQLIGVDAPIVLDPVLLYGYSEELKYQVNPHKSKYLIVYAYDKRMNEGAEVTAIKALAKKHNLEIISPGFYHKWADKNVNVNPIQLLGWFKHAEYVITDTFHGSIMSIINDRDFSVIVRDNSNKLISLLRDFGLENRIIKDLTADILRLKDSPIDYTYVNHVLNEKRISSINYLKHQIYESEP